MGEAILARRGGGGSLKFTNGKSIDVIAKEDIKAPAFVQTDSYDSSIKTYYSTKSVDNDQKPNIVQDTKPIKMANGDIFTIHTLYWTSNAIKNIASVWHENENGELVERQNLVFDFGPQGSYFADTSYTAVPYQNLATFELKDGKILIIICTYHSQSAFYAYNAPAYYIYNPADNTITNVRFAWQTTSQSADRGCTIKHIKTISNGDMYFIYRKGSNLFVDLIKFNFNNSTFTKLEENFLDYMATTLDELIAEVAENIFLITESRSSTGTMCRFLKIKTDGTYVMGEKFEISTILKGCDTTYGFVNFKYIRGNAENKGYFLYHRNYSRYYSLCANTVSFDFENLTVTTSDTSYQSIFSSAGSTALRTASNGTTSYAFTMYNGSNYIEKIIMNYPVLSVTDITNKIPSFVYSTPNTAPLYKTKKEFALLGKSDDRRLWFMIVDMATSTIRAYQAPQGSPNFNFTAFDTCIVFPLGGRYMLFPRSGSKFYKWEIDDYSDTNTLVSVTGQLTNPQGSTSDVLGLYIDETSYLLFGVQIDRDSSTNIYKTKVGVMKIKATPVVKPSDSDDGGVIIKDGKKGKKTTVVHF